MTIRILLVDDHTLVREGIREVIEADPDLTVVEEIADGRSAIEAVRRLKPDVTVMDLWLPRLAGNLALAEIRRENRRAKVVILSMHDKASMVVEVLRGGAYGYVLKTSAGSELVAAIKAAHVGKRYVSTALADELLERVADPAIPIDPIQSLTAREREILQCVAEGLSARQIARDLFISVRTVETHRTSIMRKLGVRKSSSLVRIAIRAGLAPP
jgi:DNA-binding NarL/FixJ family response regulator